MLTAASMKEKKKVSSSNKQKRSNTAGMSKVIEWFRWNHDKVSLHV
jgi:hypothetical protein